MRLFVKITGFCFLFSLIMIHVSQAQRQNNQDYYLLKDLKTEWMVYDNKNHFLIPYMTAIAATSPVIHFWIETEENLSNLISIEYPENCGIFIQDKLIDYFEKPGQVVYPVDSLDKLYKTDSLFFSIYLPAGMDRLKTVLLSSKKVSATDMSAGEFMKIRKVKRPRFSEFVKVSVILLVVLITFLYNASHRQFIQYFNISRSFSRVSTDEFLARTASFSKTDFLYMLVMSVLMAFHILMITYHRDQYKSYEELTSLSDPFAGWILLFPVIFIWYMFRILIINIFSNLFRIRDMQPIHMFELIRVTDFFSLAALIFTILAFFVFRLSFDSYSNLLIAGFLGFNFLRLSIIAIKFLNSTTYKKLYLITYLCISELIPLIIGVKYILKSSFFNSLIL